MNKNHSIDPHTHTFETNLMWFRFFLKKRKQKSLLINRTVLFLVLELQRTHDHTFFWANKKLLIIFNFTLNGKQKKTTNLIIKILRLQLVGQLYISKIEYY